MPVIPDAVDALEWPIAAWFMPAIPLIGCCEAAEDADAAEPLQPVSFASLADRFFSTVGSTGRPEEPSIPSMLPVVWSPMLPMPMSRIVASGRARRGGTGALMPARGASVARAMPERSTDSATSVNASGWAGSTMTS
jgi:hypothetical protein